MNTHAGYSKKTLDNANVLLAGGGDKSLADFLGGIQYVSASKKLLIKTAAPSASWTDLVTLVMTDENVKLVDNNNNQSSPILLKNGTGTGTITSTSIFADGVTVNPSANSLSVTGYINGKLLVAGGSFSWYNVQQYDSNDANPSYYKEKSAIININSYSGWQPWIRAVDSEKGSWAIGQYTTNFHVVYFAKTNTANSPTKNWLFGKDGTITSPGGFVHGGFNAASGLTKDSYVLLAGGGYKLISDFSGSGHNHDGRYVKLDPGAAEQTIKSSIGTLSEGVIDLWRNSGDHYTFLGFSNGTTKTYLGGIGFKSQSDHYLYRKDGSNYYMFADAANISNKDATIGTSLTTIATIAGVDIKAKIGSYAASGHDHDGRYVKLDAGAAEQTIKNSISSLANGSIEIWRALASGYAMIGFANGTTKTKLGMLGFTGTANTPTFRNTSNVDYLLAHAGNIVSADATIGSSLTTIATIAGVDIKAKVDSQGLHRLYTTKKPTSANWYRVLDITTYGTAILIAIGESYNNGNPTASTFIANLGYTTATLTQIDLACRTPSNIDKVRLVRYASGKYYVDVHYKNTNSNGNNEYINFTNLSHNSYTNGLALVDWTVQSDTLASGETLAASADVIQAFVSNSAATIGTSLTTIATIRGVAITAKIGDYAASGHTHTFAQITNKITRTNEFNFVDNEYATMWFNFRRASDTAATTLTTDFYFGRGDASSSVYASLNAEGFKKRGSDNTYVLLGGGGHKLLSELATSGHNHDDIYVKKAGDTMTGHLYHDGEKCSIYKIERKKSGGGGWAYSPFTIRGNDNASFFYMGVLGEANALTYGYIGSGTYNSAVNLRIASTYVGTTTLIPNAANSYSVGSAANPYTDLYLGKTNGSGIYYVGTKASYRMIRFIDNTGDTYGNGIAIGGGGLAVMGSGESADTLLSNLSLTTSGGTETTYIASDNSILFYPSILSWDASGVIEMTASRLWVGVNGNTTREAQVGVQSGSGQILIYSNASTTGNRGMWVPAHGSGSARAIFNVDTNNQITFADYYTGTGTKLAYSQAGMAISDITWLTCWNGYELRAINKSQVASYVIDQLSGAYVRDTLKQDQNFNMADASTSGVYYVHSDYTQSNAPSTYGLIAAFNNTAGHLQFYSSDTANDIRVRSYWWTSRSGGITYPAWVTLIHSGNIDSYGFLTSQDHYKTSPGAGTAGTSSATSGGTLAVPYITVNANGHVTAKGTHTHTVNELCNYYTSRPSTANLNADGSGKLRHFKATSSMTTANGHPGTDGHILWFSWDNTGGYDAQLHIPTSASTTSRTISYRGQSGSNTWGDWQKLVNETMLKNYAYISGGTIYIGDNSITPGTGQVSGDYLPLAGGTMTGAGSIKFNNFESSSKRWFYGGTRNAGWKYDYNGNEALIISAGTYGSAAIQFWAGGVYPTTDGLTDSGNQWNASGFVPTMHLRKRTVAINYNPGATDLSYNLYVGGKEKISATTETLTLEATSGTYNCIAYTLTGATAWSVGINSSNQYYIWNANTSTSNFYMTNAGKVTISADGWLGQLLLNRSNNGSNWGASLGFQGSGSNRGAIHMEGNELYVGDIGGTFRYKVLTENNWSNYITVSGGGSNDKVTQIPTTNSNANYRVLFKYSANNTLETNFTRSCTNLYYNMSTYKLTNNGEITATLFTRDGSSVWWVNGRNSALLRETSNAGYHAIWSLKTTNGSWDCGEYNETNWSDILVLSYISDTDYNNQNNATVYQIKFPQKSGTIALLSDIPSSSGGGGGGYIATTAVLSSSTAGQNITGTGTITPNSSHTYNIGSSSSVYEYIYTRYINTDSGYDLRICTAGTERIHVNSANGYVGIGTTAPSRPLHVIGEAIFGESSYTAPQGTGSSYNGTWMGQGWMELSNTNPYIDFHYNKSTSDYTTRLIQWDSNNRLTMDSNTTGLSGYLATCEGNQYNIVCLGVITIYRTSATTTSWLVYWPYGLVTAEVVAQPVDQDTNPIRGMGYGLILRIKPYHTSNNAYTRKYTTANVIFATATTQSHWVDGNATLGRTAGSDRNTAYDSYHISINNSTSYGSSYTSYGRGPDYGNILAIVARRPHGSNDNDYIGEVQNDGLLETGNGSIATFRLAVFGYLS